MNDVVPENGAPIAILLVHGYLGSPANLAPLAEHLSLKFGADAVTSVCLPGHGTNAIPPFDETAFLAVLADAIDGQLARGRHLVLLGHSTGGSLLLAEIARRLAQDAVSLSDLLLLVLCATPPRIDLSYVQRWSAHADERLAHPTIEMQDIGAIVSLVNRLARRAPLAVPAPVLIMHGEADELVPVEDAEFWRIGRLMTTQRHVRVPQAKHHLFSGEGAATIIDTIGRAIDDARQRMAFTPESAAPRSLYDLVPGLEPFCEVCPDSRRHILDSPAGRMALEGVFEPALIAAVEPTVANIEITTRCNLGCVACARTQFKLQSRSMSLESFRRVLAQLPHAFRIVLVGLGEPLMHPQLIDFIRLAVAAKRRVGLVTNAMLLDAEMARALCESGLSSLTVSIDAVDQAVAARLRPGSDMSLISENIHKLMAERRRQGSRMGTSVFTALTGETIAEFEAIVDFVADHEFDALMVTDLNFQSNQARSVHRIFSAEHARSLRSALKHAVKRRLPVLSVWGLEEFALDVRYLDFLLFRGEQLAHRSTRHSHCLSPWQSIPVDVAGNLSLCDCQPSAKIGNIHQIPLSDWWNGLTMIEQRRRMLGDDPPEACRVCPRF